MGLLEGAEAPVDQELLAKGLVEPLDLAGRGRRPRRGVAMCDPVLPQDPVEQHLDRLGTEPSGEDLAVVGEDLIGDPMRSPGHRRAPGTPPWTSPGQRVPPPRRTGCGHPHRSRPSARSRRQGARPHHVHLPQLHRAVALPAGELVAALAATAELDQVVALEAPVDRRARRDRLHPGARELVLDPSGTPPGVFTTELADLRLELGRDLVRASRGLWERSANAARPPAS